MNDKVRFSGTDNYIATEDLMVAVNAAVTLERPLLIKGEIDEVVSGDLDPNDNPLKNAPHTAEYATSDAWDHPYSRSRACFPMESQKDHKYWPTVGRVDNAHGDRNLICTCPDIDEYK